MNLEQLMQKIQQVADQYSEKYGIEYTDDWFVMKLQEELGEMVQAHLILSGRTRRKAETNDQAREALAQEIADVFCYTLLFAKRLNIDVEKAVKDKWFAYLENEQK